LFQPLKFIRDYRLKKSLSNAYHALILLHKSFFDSYLKQENLIKQSKKLYLQHKKFIKTLQNYRQIIKKEFHGCPASCHSRLRGNDLLLDKLENLHEIICSLHLLRFRFNEFALFEVCFREMQSLKRTSTILLHKMTKKIFNRNVCLDTNEFINAIHAFENLYSNTLQVVARDPSVFQFFIQDLYALQALMMSDT
jgi:hypothetical protein